jgi:hypothetical protein
VRYVYVVTRINKRQSKHVTEIPNLGVHASLKKALSHYNSVLEDRSERNKNVIIGPDINNDSDERMGCIRSAYVVDSDEQIRLERWKLK